MAQEIRVYRRFYVVNDDTYTSIDPYFLSATTRSFSQGGTIIEANADIVNTTVGEYYADLDRNLYNSDDVYELNWIVGYTSSAPLKNLYTKFKFPVGTSIGRDIRVEIKTDTIKTEITKNNPLIYVVNPSN